ncbi:Sec-independent protein translocase protein TatB [Streptomyces sp. RB5]|uniref:Sec-independent protein translocase protein TatB n=1 Tax=Streptomyces smaragdinus TaxID=2585196 RepID=A0A7K0CTB5_9ACTN|nr:sec-independent translocase [Streptomyces smaragdinus]MQY16727.1 Sec-independent protein translocase protein TatB [Streptomyces smaragdinus]
MFFDIGPLELIALIILAVLIFGPDKLPKVIQDVAGMIRKLREFSDSAKEDIRRELGPEFKDFEFEDLNPKKFAKKHLLDNEDLGLKELTGSFDLKKEMAEVSDAARTVGDVREDGRGDTDTKSRTSLTKETPAEGKSVAPYDADAT